MPVWEVAPRHSRAVKPTEQTEIYQDFDNKCSCASVLEVVAGESVCFELQMYRALRQVGQVAIASVVSTALLMFVYPLKVKQPASLASWHLRRISGYAPEGPPAFVFDIDGVLIQGGTVLPEAKTALAKLYTNNGMSLLMYSTFIIKFAWHASLSAMH